MDGLTLDNRCVEDGNDVPTVTVKTSKKVSAEKSVITVGWNAIIGVPVQMRFIETQPIATTKRCADCKKNDGPKSRDMIWETNDA